MALIRIKKIMDAVVTTPQIERYLINKGWTLDAGHYRSPFGGKEEVKLVDGEQSIINHLEIVERRDSFSIYQDIISLERKK